MFIKPSPVMLLILLVTLGISAESSATWQSTAWNVFKEVAMDTAIDVVQSFFIDDVKPEEVTVLKGKVSDLERQLYSVKKGGYNPPDFGSVEQTVLRLTKIVNAMESRFSSLEDRVTILEKRVTIIEQDIPFVKQTIAQWNGWFVILGSYPKTRLNEANKRKDKLQSYGYVGIYIADTDHYPNLRNGLYIVALGPLQKEDARRFKNELSKYIPDAYIKSGW